MKLSKKACVLSAVALLGGLVFAFPVEDPVQWSNTISQTAQVINQIKEVINVKNNVLGTWNQLKSDAQFLTSAKDSWRGFFMNAVSSPVANRAGETDGWYAAINQGLNVANTQGRTFERLSGNPGLVLGSHLAINYANAEIGASATTGAMQTLGTAKSVQRAMVDPIGNCENSALSTSGSNNTAAANSNIANGCAALGIRQGQTALSVETARLELETYAAKRQVDADTQMTNMRVADAATRKNLTVGDTADAIKSVVDR
jgi:hypothetical protein